MLGHTGLGINESAAKRVIATSPSATVTIATLVHPLV